MTLTTKKQSRKKPGPAEVVATFRRHLDRLAAKIAIVHFAEAHDTMRREGSLPRRALTTQETEELGEALVEAICPKHRDPDDAQQRTEAETRLRAMGINGIADVAGGTALGRASWRSVLTPLADASEELVKTATGLGFATQEVACADELTVDLRHGLHACPNLEMLARLARPLGVLTAQMLRKADAALSNKAAAPVAKEPAMPLARKTTPRFDFVHDAVCVAIAKALRKGPETGMRPKPLQAQCGGGQVKGTLKDRLRRMKEAGLVEQNKPKMPWRLTAKGLRLFQPK